MSGGRICRERNLFRIWSCEKVFRVGGAFRSGVQPPTGSNDRECDNKKGGLSPKGKPADDYRGTPNFMCEEESDFTRRARRRESNENMTCAARRGNHARLTRIGGENNQSAVPPLTHEADTKSRGECRN